jgi:hypothetical protein
VATVIQFPNKKTNKEGPKGNAALSVNASFTYEVEKQEMQVRMERIFASLNRINELLRDLKQPKR